MVDTTSLMARQAAIHSRMHERKTALTRSTTNALVESGTDRTHMHRRTNKCVDGRVVSKNTGEGFMSTSPRLIGTSLESLEGGNPMGWGRDDGGCGTSMRE